MICPNCENEVFSKTKYCEHCGKNLEGDVIIKEKDISFIKHLFNWKFYIAPILYGILLGFDYYSRMEYDIVGIDIIPVIIAIIMTVKYKSTFMKKFTMFISSYITIGLTILITMFLFAFVVFSTLLGQSNGQLISNMLSQNKNLPKMFNTQIEQMSFKKENYNEITSNFRFVNYTKNEVLNEYENKIALFEEQMLKNELELSCNEPNVKIILDKDIQFNINYFDKNHQLIGMIFLDKLRCKPFSKQ